MVTENRVLVVDDEMDLCLTLQRMFELEKFEVVTATSLEECVRRGLLTDTYDVIILDLGLNEPATETARGDFLLPALVELKSAVVRVVYTGNGDNWLIVHCLQLGATDYVSKLDCAPSELVSRVVSTLKLRTKQREDFNIIRAFVIANCAIWESEYPGKVLAIAVAVDSSMQTVDRLAVGDSRLDAIIKYRAAVAHRIERYPELPHLHFVPGR